MLAQNENVGTPPEKKGIWLKVAYQLGFVFEQDANDASRFFGGYPKFPVVLC